MAAPPNGPKGWWDKETNKLPAAAIEGPSQPGAHGPIVFLLGNRTSHADFEGFARGHDWLIHEDRPSTGPKSAYEQIWVTPDRSTAIHYMDDPTPKERFLVVHGREAGAVAFQMGAANLDIHTSEDVFNLAMVASSTPERITVAWQLAVTSRLYDEAVLGILWALYDGANDLVRAAVVNAIGYRGWPESRAFLEEVARDDASADLRENARNIVDAWGDEAAGARSEQTTENHGERSATKRSSSQASQSIPVERERLKGAPPNGPIVFLLGNRTSHTDFERFARKYDWLVHEDRPSKGPKRPYEQIWLTPDHGTAIHYMDDPTPKERFLVVYGRDTGTVAIQMGAALLDIHTSWDVFDRALVASSTSERIDVAWQLAVTSKLYDEAIFGLLKSWYDGANDLVRAAVVNAIGYRGWPESRAFLEEVARDDASADLRENARNIVDAWWGDEAGAAASELSRVNEDRLNFGIAPPKSDPGYLDGEDEEDK